MLELLLMNSNKVYSITYHHNPFMNNEWNMNAHVTKDFFETIQEMYPDWNFEEHADEEGDHHLTLTNGVYKISCVVMRYELEAQK